MAGSETGMRRLRVALAEDRTAAAVMSLSDEAVIAALVTDVMQGKRVLLGGQPRMTTSPTMNEEDGPVPEDNVLTSTTFIEFKVVLTSGKPVGSVRLEVTVPSGEVKKVTTGKDGVSRMEPVDRGDCAVRSPWGKDARADTLGFAGIDGGSAVGSEDAPKQSEQQAQAKSGMTTIAAVERYKVKKGDTLDVLAKSVGLTWKELAKFNFDTENPDEINRALRRVVGCRKKTKDGKNYLFDDADDPGIVLLPKAWEAKGLAAGSSHIIVVEPVEVHEKAAPRWIFSI